MPASAPSSICGIGSTSRCSGSAAGRGARRPSGPRSRGSSRTAGAVGEILIAPFDLDGVFVCPTLRDRVLAFDARALGRVPVVDRRRGGREQGPPDPGRPSSRDREDTRDRRRDRRGASWLAMDAPMTTPDDRDPRHRSRHDRGQGRPGRSRRPAARHGTGGLRARGRPRTGLGGTGPGGLVVRGGRRRPRASHPPEPVDIVAIGVDGHGPTLAAVDDARRGHPTGDHLPRYARRRPRPTSSLPRRASAAGRSVRCRPPCGWSATSPMSRRGPAGTSRPGSGWPSA